MVDIIAPKVIFLCHTEVREAGVRRASGCEVAQVRYLGERRRPGRCGRLDMLGATHMSNLEQ